MSCPKCKSKNSKCGCADSPFTIPANFSNNPEVCPEDSEKCTEVFLAECICWPGPDICELDIKKGDRINEVLEKLILTVSQVSCGNDGLPGEPGQPGQPGQTGNGIASVTWFSNSAGQPATTQGTTDTYLITYTNSSTDTFEVYNGADGEDGEDGNGIVSTSWTSNSGSQPQGTQGTTDTYTITYDDATTSTFIVTNGANGGGGGGGLTWITNTSSGAGGLVSTLSNYGYVQVDTINSSNEVDYLLPTGAAVGDVVKVIVRSGRAGIQCDATQLIIYGSTPAFTSGAFTDPFEFLVGQGETIQMIYAGAGEWVIDNFQSFEETPGALNRILS